MLQEEVVTYQEAVGALLVEVLISHIIRIHCFRLTDIDTSTNHGVFIS